MDNFNAAEAARRLMALEAAQGAAGVPGMAGTPGGPVQESPNMISERMLQLAPGWASAIGLGYGLATGNPAAMMMGGGAMMATDPLSKNAMSPNIRDVWADQLRMKLQGN
jgi:hypothetical protein